MSSADAAAPAPATPELPPLEAALQAYAATNPEDAALLMKRIGEIKEREESATKRLASLEHRSVDEEVLRDQLTQLQAYLQAPISTRFHVGAETVASQLASDKPAIVANAAQRVVAACNAQFMSMSAAVAEESDRASKRARAAPAPEPPAAAAPATPVAGSGALKRALAAMYE